MDRAPTPKLGAYAALTAAGLLAALVLGQPALAVLVAPFGLLLALGLPQARDPGVEAVATLGADRTMEGDPVTLTVTVRARHPVARLEVAVPLPPELEAEDGPPALRLRIGRGDVGPEHGLERALTLRCRRWGALGVEPVRLRARDHFGFHEWRAATGRRQVLRVYPRPAQLHSLLLPNQTQVHSGNQLARQRGDGIEFADIRPFVPGDRVRRVNWRVSARRGQPYVNQHHLERNADVILFVDSFAEARTGREGTLDLTVRLVSALAAGHVARRDRVGLIGFGGILRWLSPGMGPVHLLRVVEALLDTEVVLSYAWKGLDIIPPRTLPPQAMVVALTPLLDARAIGALLDLRARGFDLAVVEVDPERFVPPATDPGDRLADRVWHLHREARRARLAEAGIPIARWGPGEPADQPLTEIAAFRRALRRVPA